MGTDNAILLKKYVCVMFPYPSGEAMHIGHAYNYTIIDSYCRYLRYIGYEVFQPFGYDSFGLPAENYARSINQSPAKVTNDNIEKFRLQMKLMDTQYEELLVTCEPSYIKWTQWLFLKLKEHGLAYKANGNVNYCTSCETVLANEQVKDGKCDRCGSLVETRIMNQWYFKTTAYKERLIKNLDWIDYPEGTIKQQRNWLENLQDWCVSRQRSWGCPIPVDGETDTLDTFVDSSFYYIRYCDSENSQELCSKERYRQVDLYVGGNEHACQHLILSRFVNMFLYDIGLVAEEEPFKKVIHQGMILSAGEKMSKSKGNVVNPMAYDSDELRFFLMFIGHYFDGGNWSDENIKGVRRFIGKMQEWMTRQDGTDDINFTDFKIKVLDFTKAFKFNKVVSEFMTFLNNNRHKNISAGDKESILSLLELYMPSITKKIYGL